jgi:hypothetical protein
MMSDFVRVFTLEVDGRPTLTFEAQTFREAQQLCKEAWLRTDLGSLNSDGIPLWDGKTFLSVRRASDEEAIVFDQAAKEVGPSEDMVLAYLIELDGPATG